jgi:hypothetical protein
VGTDIIEAMDSLTPAGYAQLSALTNTAVQGQDRKLLLARIAEIRKQLETRFPDQSERLTKAYRQISTELLPQ